MNRPSPLTKLWRLWREGIQIDKRLKEPLPYRAWKWLWQRKSQRTEVDGLFERLQATDWDVLVLLDACRYDVLSDLTTNAVIQKTSSPASATPEFLTKAQNTGVFDGSVYLSGNPQSAKHSPGDVEHVSVFDGAWDDELETVPPGPLYQTAMEYVGGNKQVVVHTLQPHYPHICQIGNQICAVPGGLHPKYFQDERLRDQKLQAILSNGYIEMRRAQKSYERCVRFAWKRASEFAVKAASEGNRVVISADHAELFGELGFVEHPVGLSLKSVTEVPWVVFEPPSETNSPEDVTDRLAALGYVEN